MIGNRPSGFHVGQKTVLGAMEGAGRACSLHASQTVAFACLSGRQANPKGIASSSPRLRGTSYLGKGLPLGNNPNGVVAPVHADRIATTPLGLALIWDVFPRVVRSAANPGLGDGIPLGFPGNTKQKCV